MSQEFYVLITMYSADDLDRINDVLTKRGYVISPLATSGKLFHSREDNQVIIGALYVSKNFSAEETSPKTTIIHEIADVCKVAKLQYLSIVVLKPADVSWDVGNVKTLDSAWSKIKKSPFGAN